MYVVLMLICKRTPLLVDAVAFPFLFFPMFCATNQLQLGNFSPLTSCQCLYHWRHWRSTSDSFSLLLHLPLIRARRCHWLSIEWQTSTDRSIATKRPLSLSHHSYTFVSSLLFLFKDLTSRMRKKMKSPTRFDESYLSTSNERKCINQRKSALLLFSLATGKHHIPFSISMIFNIQQIVYWAITVKNK